MEFRLIFDTIPCEFDRWRPRYCDSLFNDVIEYSALGKDGAALEIGPGTGQATEPILKTGCEYLAVELGGHLAAFTAEKFSRYDNFHIINGDFAEEELGENRFDLVYSAATIQWIDEELAFPKANKLLKRGGTLAMFYTRTDYKTPDEELYCDIQKVYTDYFHPDTPYNRRFVYSNAVNYGFTDFHTLEYKAERLMTADEFTAMTATHCDHIILCEPERSRFFDGIKKAIEAHGGKILLLDTMVLHLAKKE